MSLLYIGPVFKDSGYGVAATLNCAALSRAKVQFKILPTDQQVRPTGRYEHLAQHLVGPEALHMEWTHIIAHAVPSELKTVAARLPTTGKLIAYTTWESDPVPKQYVEEIQANYDVLLVPSQWNVGLFQSQGIKPTFAAPHPFDPDWWWAPELASAPGQTAGRPTTAYRFYSVITWNERKNPIGLLKAYFHAFTSEDDVELIIVTPSWVADEVKALVAGMHLNDLPKVTMRGVINDDGRLTDEQYRQLHYDCQCYVSTTRGEAWGLGMFEAAVIGNPIIAPHGGGQQDFLDPYLEEGARQGDYDRVSAAPCQLTPVLYPETPGSEVQLGGMKIRTVTRNTHEGARGDQLWFEPDLIEISMSMKEAYDMRWKRNPACWKAFEQFTLESVGQRFKQVLESL